MANEERERESRRRLCGDAGEGGKSIDGKFAPVGARERERRSRKISRVGGVERGIREKFIYSREGYAYFSRFVVCDVSEGCERTVGALTLALLRFCNSRF